MTIGYGTRTLYDRYGSALAYFRICTACAAWVADDNRQWDIHVRSHTGYRDMSLCDVCGVETSVADKSRHISYHVAMKRERDLLRKSLLALLSGEKVDLRDLEELVQ